MIGRSMRCAALLALALVPAHASAEGVEEAVRVVELSVAPISCVTLYEDQPCHQRLVFRWKTPAGARYCLHRERASEPLICWDGDELERHAFRFLGSSAESFSVRRSDGEVLATVRVALEWVYRGGRRGTSGWRLF